LIEASHSISRKKTTWWGLFFQYASIAVSLLSGFIVLPVSLRFIPLDLYGAWLASGNILVWLTIVDPGLGAIVQQRVGEAYGGKNFERLTSLAWSGIAINGILVLVIVSAGLVLANYVPGLLNLSPDLDASLVKTAFVWAVVGTGLSFLAFSVANVNIGLQATVGIGFPPLVIFMASIALTIIFLYMGFGLLAAPVANVFRGGGLLVWNLGYFVWRFRKEGLSLKPSLQEVPGLIKLSLYTFVSSGVGTLSNNMDSFLVSRVLGPMQVPVLRATRTTIDSFRPLVERPFVALMPALSHVSGSGEFEKARTILLRLTVLSIWAVVMIGGGFLMLNDRLVHLWVGSNLFAGQPVNAVLCLGLAGGAVTSGLLNVCFSMGAIERVSRIKTAQGIFQIALMGLLGWRFGMIGIVAAPLIATACIGGWMIPRLFGKLMNFGRAEYIGLFRESFYAIAAAGVASFSVAILSPANWLNLALCAILFTSSFVLTLAVLSNGFRREIREGWRLVVARASRYGLARMPT